MQPHFVSQYQRLVSELIATHPLDEAMSLAVGGGSREEIAKKELEILMACGLHPMQTVVELGCGNGALARTLAARFPAINYMGLDIVPELIDYARKGLTPNFRFALNPHLSIPVEAESIDSMIAFSVFTHLYHEETFVYLREAHRVLRPGGAAVFSFLEMGEQWSVFETMISEHYLANRPFLNMFIERSAIMAWATRLNMKLDFVGSALGQSVARLTK